MDACPFGSLTVLAIAKGWCLVSAVRCADGAFTISTESRSPEAGGRDHRRRYENGRVAS